MKRNIFFISFLVLLWVLMLVWVFDFSFNAWSSPAGIKMDEILLGISASFFLYLVYVSLSKLLRRFRKSVEPASSWRKRWSFTLNWLFLSAFLWMWFSAGLVYIGMGAPSARQMGMPHMLEEIGSAQETFHKEYGRYARDFVELKWRPEEGRNLWYSFFMGEDALSQLPSGVSAPIADDKFTVIAIKDLDGDEEKDIWRITGPSGSVEHVYDDRKIVPGVAAIAVFTVTALCFAVISFILNLRQNKKLQQAESDKIKPQQMGIQSQKED